MNCVLSTLTGVCQGVLFSGPRSHRCVVRLADTWLRFGANQMGAQATLDRNAKKLDSPADAGVFKVPVPTDSTLDKNTLK